MAVTVHRICPAGAGLTAYSAMRRWKLQTQITGNPANGARLPWTGRCQITFGTTKNRKGTLVWARAGVSPVEGLTP
jgi:hypothetical protein